MPTLLEVQRAMYRSVTEHDDERTSAYVVAGELTASARLDIYRNTFVSNLTGALRIAYPAVYGLVGAEFFEGAAAIFVRQQVPRRACLDDYGAEFADFLERFPPAAGIGYLPGVARLEWAVNTALHAPDAAALDLDRLAAAGQAHDGRLVLVPHPSVGLVHDAHPVDAIWRAVVAQDDAAMAAITLDGNPAWLLVDRQETGVEVTRISENTWRLMSELCAARPLQAAFAVVVDTDVPAMLAEHLAAGRFVDFKVADQTGPF